MIRPVHLFTATLATLGNFLLGSSASYAASEVDLALVLAVDISGSMDPDEQKLQRKGFVEAFRSPLVHDVIQDGMVGRIAVAYVEWAGYSVQHIVVPWTVIEGAEDAMEFAERLRSTPIRRGPRTSVSGAIDFSIKLFTESGVSPLRRVIDISGDGANNQGRIVTEARDEAVAQNITINGLPLMLKRPSGSWDTVDLDLYFRDCVIGGPGAFMIPVRERGQFAEAIKTKVIREIADASPKHLIQKAQAVPAANCLAGERRLDHWDRN